MCVRGEGGGGMAKKRGELSQAESCANTISPPSTRPFLYILNCVLFIFHFFFALFKLFFGLNCPRPTPLPTDLSSHGLCMIL